MMIERWANRSSTKSVAKSRISGVKGEGVEVVISLDLWKPIELLGARNFLYGTICTSNPGLRFAVLGCALIWFKATTVLATVLRSWSSYWLHGPSRESLRNTRESAMKRDNDTHACVHARKWHKIRRRSTGFFRSHYCSSLNFKSLRYRMQLSRIHHRAKKLSSRNNLHD